MKDPMCVEQKVKIAPLDYSKENYLATFTPQKQLTPEKIFWSNDILKENAKALKEKAKALKEKAKVPKPITAMTVYPPNTPIKLRITPTGFTKGERGFEQTKTCYLTEVILFFKIIKEHFKGIQKALINEVKDQHVVDKKCDKIERKNLLIENENLIAGCLSKEVFYTTINSVFTVSRFSDMHDAYTVAQKRIAELEAENSNLTHKIQKDDHDEMIKHFSKLEVEHLNLQLKYQHLKERFGNKKSVTSSDAPAFDSVFVIENLKEQLQGRGNTIRELKETISRLKKKHSAVDPILDFKALDLNECFRAENEKVKQHYKELYDSIKLTHAKTIEKTTSLLTEIENLKAQIKGKTKCVTMPAEKPKVLAPGMYAIDVGPIPPRNRNNREVHLDYLKHLKESVETLCEIIEEARVEKPLDRSLASACLYTKQSQELLEYVIGTCLKDFRVKGDTTASGSKPRRNTKKDRTLPAKSDKKKVEDHHK
ncbi:hypothetical protein Tco_1443259, partial [Tanacetum coccineum]